MNSTLSSEKLSRTQIGQIMSAFSGWLMDGYTSIAYLVVAITFSNVFFPAKFSQALLLIFLGLVVGSVARLIGSLILGNFLGDRLGRKKMLIYSIMGFSFSSFLIAFIPTYKTVGYLATVILYSLLFVVGLFAGAEYAGGTALSMESVPQKKRMPVGAFVQSGYGVGYFLILLVAAGFTGYFGQAQSTNLVWRALFATTIIPGIIALVIRLSSKESPVFDEMKNKNEIEHIPAEGMLKQWYALLAALFIVVGLLLLNTITLGFYPTLIPMLYPILYGTATNDLYNSYINLISLFGVWIGGFAAYIIFRRRVTLLLFSTIFLISIVPLYLLAMSGSVFLTVLAFAIQAFIEAAIFSTIPAYLAEVFQKTHRATTIGVVYNGAAVPASFGISAVLLLGGHGFFNSDSISWLLFLFIGAIILIIGIIMSKESSNLKNDPILN